MVVVVVAGVSLEARAMEKEVGCINRKLNLSQDVLGLQ